MCIVIQKCIKKILKYEIFFLDDFDDDAVPIKDEAVTPEHLHRLYVFALTWGLGAVLNSTGRVKMDGYFRKNFPTLDLPKDPDWPSATIFDFFVCHLIGDIIFHVSSFFYFIQVGNGGLWQLWKSLVTPYQYPELSTPDYLSILVPIPENVRIEYFIRTIALQEKAVLLIGEQGTAKTVMLKNFMKGLNPESYMIRSFNFSSATSPYQFQKTIESYVDKRMGNTFGPPGGRKLIVFIGKTFNTD